MGAKAKNVSAEKKQEGWGDIWTWVGIDADTKLVVSYLVGGRDRGWAKEFMEDCAHGFATGYRSPQTVIGLIWMRWKVPLARILITPCSRRFTALVGERDALLAGEVYRLRHEGCERRS